MNDAIFEAMKDLAVGVLGVLGGGFGIAWLNRRKTNAEAKRITVEADQVEVKGHLETIDRILEFNRDLLTRVEKLERMVEAGDKREQALEARVGELFSKVQSLETENANLRARCRKLETENAELREALPEG